VPVGAVGRGRGRDGGDDLRQGGGALGMPKTYLSAVEVLFKVVRIIELRNRFILPLSYLGVYRLAAVLWGSVRVKGKERRKGVLTISYAMLCQTFGFHSVFHLEFWETTFFRVKLLC
jgi:hypothetical protein